MPNEKDISPTRNAEAWMRLLRKEVSFIRNRIDRVLTFIDLQLPPDEPVVFLGDRLRRARVKAGISQRELSLRIATTTSEVSRYESGQRVPSGLTRIALERFISEHPDENPLSDEPISITDEGNPPDGDDVF